MHPRWRSLFSKSFLAWFQTSESRLHLCPFQLFNSTPPANHIFKGRILKTMNIISTPVQVVVNWHQNKFKSTFIRLAWQTLSYHLQVTASSAYMSPKSSFDRVNRQIRQLTGLDVVSGWKNINKPAANFNTRHSIWERLQRTVKVHVHPGVTPTSQPSRTDR